MIQAICWTLVHSLWQGLLLAILAGTVMLVMRSARAAERYYLLSGLFVLFLLGCAGTFVYELSGRDLPETAGERGAVGDIIGGWLRVLGQYCTDHAALIVWGWMFVSVARMLRMAGHLLYVQRIRHHGARPASAEWQDQLDALCVSMGIRRAVRLVESTMVKMPMVAGYWRPMIFLPAGVLLGLSASEVEAVLRHELAHVRRHDYVMNLLQQVAGHLLFFNPGLLWVSALMRDEREHCCDDVAMHGTGDKVGLVRALISFSEYDRRVSPAAALGLPGRRGLLLRRVARIVENAHDGLGRAERVFLMMGIAVMFVLVMGYSGAPSGSGRERADGDRAQAQREMEQAERDKLQAERDREQVQRDRSQAERDRENVMREWEQAERDRGNVMREREQAERDKLQADRNREDAIRDREQAERDREQAQRVREETQRNREEAQRVRIQ